LADARRYQQEDKELLQIAQKLEKLQEQQERLQERLKMRLPQLAEALKNAQVTSLDIQKDIDQLIVKVGLVAWVATSSTTTAISSPALPSDLLKDRAQKAIERAEHKITLVENKLMRFSSSTTPFLLFDNKKYKGSKSFLPSANQKQLSWYNLAGRVAFARNKSKDKLELKFLNPQEVSEWFSEAKVDLTDAKTAFTNGNYEAAYGKAIEAFKKAIEAEGLINRSFGFGPIVFPSLPPPATTTPDIVAPVISGISDTNISTSSATIVWVTNEPATSLVEYGTSSAYGLSVSSSALVTNHSLSLSNLAADTLYHFRVSSKDTANNQSFSTDTVFTTAATSNQ